MKQLERLFEAAKGMSKITKVLVLFWAAIIVSLLTAAAVLEIGAGTFGNYYVLSEYKDGLLACLKPSTVILGASTVLVEYFERKARKSE